MRKRSAYRPKPRLVNPLAYVLESLQPVAMHDSFLMDLKIKNHAAMALLVRGQATRVDMDTLIAMSNITEALWRAGFGREYDEVMREGRAALLEVARRGSETNRFIVRAAEMNALNTLMELHDAQMDVITVKDMERAVQLVRSEIANRRATPIIQKAMA